MGISYFNCWYCNTVINDSCDDFDEMRIDLLAEYTIIVCKDCSEELVTNKLVLAEPWTQDVLVDIDEDDEIGNKPHRLSFNSLAKTKQTTVGKSAKFGLVKNPGNFGRVNGSLWSAPTTAKAVVEAKSWCCELLPSVSKLSLDSFKSFSSNCSTIYIGWYDHSIMPASTPLPDKLVCNGNLAITSKDFTTTTVSWLQSYAAEQQLVNRPSLITSVADYIKTFCKPTAVEAHWFNSFEELEAACWSLDYIDGRVSGLHWKPTKDFLKEKISTLELTILYKSSHLEQLTETLKNYSS